MNYWQQGGQHLRQERERKNAGLEVLGDAEKKLRQVESVLADPTWTPDPDAKEKVLTSLREGLEMLRRGMRAL